MIDTHSHIRTDETPKIEGLKAVILSASNLTDSRENVALAKNYSLLHPAVGIHPQEVPDDIDKTIETLDKLLSENNVIAIGECGLEFTEGVDKERQEILFRGQVALSLKHHKPLIVHSREAAEETSEILKSYKNLRGVIHCYTGGKKRVKKYLEISDNWYFGIDGNLTYEVGLEQVINEIPRDRLVLETDSPFLTPIPHRGETNYPEYIRYTYKKLTEIWGLTFEKTEKIVDDNAIRLFELTNND